jgi:hypothetical protein
MDTWLALTSTLNKKSVTQKWLFFKKAISALKSSTRLGFASRYLLYSTKDFFSGLRSPASHLYKVCFLLSTKGLGSLSQPQRAKGSLLCRSFAFMQRFMQRFMQSVQNE